jgi:hypothetical protein
MVYSISGDLILGPTMYPSSVKASQLKSDLAENAGAKMVQHLMIGDKVLGWNESIAKTHGQEHAGIISLNCILSSPAHISARFHNPYQDYVMGWSLEVKPLDEDVDVAGWLGAINNSEADSAGNLGTHEQPKAMETSQLFSRLERYVKGYASEDLQQADWEKFQSLVRQAGSGQFVEMTRRQHGPEMFGGTVGFRAAFAGLGISFLAHVFY